MTRDEAFNKATTLLDGLVPVIRPASADEVNAWRRTRNAIANALLAVERETAQKCAEIVDDTDTETIGSGYMQTDDARATLVSARDAIRKEFGLEGI